MEKRYKQVKARFTEREYDMLKQAAEQKHVTLSTYLRMSVLEAAAAIVQTQVADHPAVAEKPSRTAKTRAKGFAAVTGIYGAAGPLLFCGAFGPLAAAAKALLQRRAGKSRQADAPETTGSKRAKKKKESGDERKG